MLINFYRYSTVSTLLQHYLLLPLKHKDSHLLYLTNELSSSSMIIFTRTVHDAQRLSLVLRRLGFPAIPLHGQMTQSLRLASLNKFKSGGRSILVATDVASRGLDIPLVDLVIVSSLCCKIGNSADLSCIAELRHADQLERLCSSSGPYCSSRTSRQINHPRDAIRRRNPSAD